MASLCMRNVLCEFYLDKPNGFNRVLARSSKILPVIRLFGILESGQKCCVHIHGVFPYIVLRLGTPLTPEVSDVLRSTLASLVSHRKPNIRSEIIEASIYDIVSFDAKSLYGYYNDDDHFAKIFFTNPQYLRVVSNVLYEEAISNPILQVYEAHTPYLMQFFIDYSIFGMDLVHFNDVKFRISPIKDIGENYFAGMTVGKILSDASLLSPLLPSTNVAIECDVFASNISNAQHYTSSEGLSSNPGLDYIWKDEMRRCRQRGKKLMIESSQEERPPPITANERDWLDRLCNVVKKLKSLLNDGVMANIELTARSTFDSTIIEMNRTLMASNSTENAEAVIHEEEKEEDLILELSEHDTLLFQDDEAEYVDSRKEHEVVRRLFCFDTYIGGLSSNPGLDYIWKDEMRRCRQRGKKLMIESSQEERPPPITANERDWLDRLCNVVKKLKSLLNDGVMANIELTARSTFDSTIIEMNRTLMASNSTENAEAVIHEEEKEEDLILELSEHDTLLFQDDEAEYVDSRKEHEVEMEDMSQPLFSLYLPSQKAGRSWVQDKPNANNDVSRSTSEVLDDASRNSDVDSFLEELSRLTSYDGGSSKDERLDCESAMRKPSRNLPIDFSLLDEAGSTKRPDSVSNLVSTEAMRCDDKDDQKGSEQGSSQSNGSGDIFEVEHSSGHGSTGTVRSNCDNNLASSSQPEWNRQSSSLSARTLVRLHSETRIEKNSVKKCQQTQQNSQHCISEGSEDLFEKSSLDSASTSKRHSSQRSDLNGSQTPRCSPTAIASQSTSHESISRTNHTSLNKFRPSKRAKTSTPTSENVTSAEKQMSEEEDIIWNMVESYENDIGSLWSARRPVKRRIDFDRFHYKIISGMQIKGTQDSDDSGVWLSPTFQLPLRCRSDPITSSDNEPNQTVMGETMLEFSQRSVDEQSDRVNYETMLESWYERRSFNNYEGVEEKLEATVRIPSGPGSNPDTDHTDLRHLCVMSMEVLAPTRPGCPVPDPQFDRVIGIFCSVSLDVCMQESDYDEECILLDSSVIQTESSSEQIICVENESALFDAFAEIVKRIDPDMVIGYDTRRYSWGYLMERSIALGRNLLSELSRYTIDVSEYYRPDIPKFVLDPSPRGRLLLNIWRILRHELALRSYTRSAIVQTVLGRRFPHFSHSAISEWICSGEKHLISVVTKHLRLCARLNLQIMSQLDLFTRTAEMARVYGIQFAEVLSRGSQFRVESMLLRLARRHSLAAPSVSPAQRTAMCAPEVLPLNMEPESGYYRDPVIVLDFQSLYPSIMIAYNYCFSTCLGKVSNMDNVSQTGLVDSMELGGLVYSLPANELTSMVENGNVHISPTGTAFCKKSIRRGIMPIMLEEILNTRIMVKKAAKDYKDSRRLARILDARQMALKFVANVTYGYSAANFSGRMPCVEVADSIVSKGRETLERAIAHVNEGNYGQARVIYGDTDSMFVLCPGSTRKEAFEIGEKIANDVTMANPNPVKLKLEKVMHPLVLESKKRYVGMSYEKLDDTEGVFDAKGIETVRRDSCPLVSRILEKSLRLLFADKVAAVVRYLDMQLSNLDRVPLSDFVFSRQYRSTYADTAVVAAKRISEKRRAKCARDEPESGERVPYVIVDGELNATLISCVREPNEYVKNPRLTLNYDYYVQRHVLPSLQRAFNYVPLHFEWCRPTNGDCYKCGALGARPWCEKCSHNPKALLLALCDDSKQRQLHSQLDRACRKCLGLRLCDIEYSSCVNMACAVVQKRITLRKSNTSQAVALHSLSKTSAL
ncbi:DNA polymerase zeta catalytic subunit [Toxocara canis]|uniref:DNA polymerase n=1 Tax=Toxocara canis TaxID=6265 RepID=A0A0B2UPD6_TOXCA|nr:DNA polymerase zeta catalytic subunit [Toxocara canis]